MATDPIISVRELMGLPALPVLFDARPGAAGERAYAGGHLPGAIHVLLDRDLSAPADPSRGGRHPLPDVQTFCQALGRWGVTPERYVVVYDDQGGANAAARLWWMLRALGHARVRVLDGGVAAAQAAGVSLTTAPSAPLGPAAPYPASGFDALTTSDASEVESARRDQARCVIDVRVAARFRGEHEPIDPIAGHIPGAVNVPLSENLAADDCFKSAEALRALYAPVLGERNPEACIVHCGSGVTACHTLLAMERANLSGAALYVGSWSEWCRNPWPREP